MLISHLYKFIFIKTSKTAGTSVENYFERYCMPAARWTINEYPSQRKMYVSETGIIGQRGNLDDANMHQWYEHQAASEVRLHIGEQIWNTYTKFGGVRNPFDQAVSMYFMHKMNGNQPVNSLIEEQAEFEKWLLAGRYSNDQHIYLVDGKPCFDEVIRYERFNEDVERLCNKFGVPFNLFQMGKFGQKSRPIEFNSLNLYTEAGKRMIESHCAFELNHFNYSFPTSTFKCL